MWISKAMKSWPVGARRYVEQQGNNSWIAPAARYVEQQGNDKLVRSGRALIGAARQ